MPTRQTVPRLEALAISMGFPRDLRWSLSRGAWEYDSVDHSVWEEVVLAFKSLIEV